MRYWGYFAAKVAVAGGVLYGILCIVTSQYPEGPDPKIDPLGAARAALDTSGTKLLIDFELLAWFLLCAGILYLIIRDQRYRCRVCLRQLRMPVETGSWGKMLLLGRPRIEYICPYGHGTLKADELQISGLANPEWTPNSDDIWEELAASSKDSGDPQ